MNKNKEAYTNYVCPYCWNTLDKCTCELFPPYHLILIDRNIQEHVRLLNEKGYRTMACCEGHRMRCINTYITFADDYFKAKMYLNNLYYAIHYLYSRTNHLFSIVLPIRKCILLELPITDRLELSIQIRNYYKAR